MKEKEPTEKKDTSKDLLSKYLKENKADHLNYDETIKWTCSTGSLIFDAELGGGYKPGAYKVAGASFGGKSHEVASCLLNGLKKIPNAKGLWVKAEGRLDEEIQERSGVKFVFSAEEWEVGTCFVFETNIFEASIDLINKLIRENPNNYRYFMVIDSVDGLIHRADMIKESDKSEQIGAAGLLTSVMFKKANLVHKLNFSSDDSKK